MASENLKEKVFIAAGWLILFAAIYFVIGIFLITNGVSFEGKKVYELLKDTLTLAASFLAPVAAFVLFNDWRLEHSLISNEKFSMIIRDKVTDLEILSFHCFPSVEESEDSFKKKQDEYINLLAEIRSLALRLKGVNRRALQLKENLYTLNMVASRLLKSQGKNFKKHRNPVQYSDDIGGEVMQEHFELLSIVKKIEILHV
ncbi:hypothetical protein [Acinetobacter larvae]|uniref:DUF4760 domain-containing protein n=1 Tax=Acinetobacter larvae TaxID=1789224 RepID=A0A1B2LZ53_9GAMM|nr:hypothetical protein [Acinetobacter larvae]AOA58214.1 hypothetical protein BFG52_07525 [Acinetobacter larvae]